MFINFRIIITKKANLSTFSDATEAQQDQIVYFKPKSEVFIQDKDYRLTDVSILELSYSSKCKAIY